MNWLIPLTLLGVSLSASADDGSEKFTPTRLDWLVVELNAQNSLPSLNTTGVFVQFHPLPPNRINILAFGLSKVPPKQRKHLETLIGYQKSMALKAAEDRGWKWLNVVITPMD